MKRLAFLVLTLTAACGATEAPADDPARIQYEKDKRHCESVSNLEAAQKSCMTYRGWPEGKFRR